MSEDPKANPAAGEPSMEDILASIRRILADDGTQEAALEQAPGASTPVKAGADEDEGREPGALAAEMLSATEVPDLDVIEAGPEAKSSAGDVFLLSPEMRLPTPGGGREPPRAMRREPPVVSPPVSDTSTDVLAQLAKAILDRRDIAIGARDVTLESMVREMLRPMLREWLDRNLPYLIERLVKKEIDLMVNRAERLDD